MLGSSGLFRGGRGCCVLIIVIKPQQVVVVERDTVLARGGAVVRSIVSCIVSWGIRRVRTRTVDSQSPIDMPCSATACFAISRASSERLDAPASALVLTPAFSASCCGPGTALRLYPGAFRWRM